MNPLSKITTIVAVAMTCAFASAESIDLTYNGIVGGGSADRARINSSTYYAGHMSLSAPSVSSSKSTPRAVRRPTRSSISLMHPTRAHPMARPRLMLSAP